MRSMSSQLFHAALVWHGLLIRGELKHKYSTRMVALQIEYSFVLTDLYDRPWWQTLSVRYMRMWDHREVKHTFTNIFNRTFAIIYTILILLSKWSVDQSSALNNQTSLDFCFVSRHSLSFIETTHILKVCYIFIICYICYCMFLLLLYNMWRWGNGVI